MSVNDFINVSHVWPPVARENSKVEAHLMSVAGSPHTFGLQHLRKLYFCGPGLQSFGEWRENSKFLIQTLHPNCWVAFHNSSPAIPPLWPIVSGEQWTKGSQSEIPHSSHRFWLTARRDSNHICSHSRGLLFIQKGNTVEFNIHTFQAMVFQAFLPSQTWRQEPGLKKKKKQKADFGIGCL